MNLVIGSESLSTAELCDLGAEGFFQSDHGIDHGIVGGLIAKKWRLSPAFIAALECHHQPDKSLPEHQQLVFIVALADIYSQLLDIESCETTPNGTALAEYLMERVGVDWPTLYDMRDTVLAEIEKAKIYLEISE